MLRRRLARHPGDNVPATPFERVAMAATTTQPTPHAASASRAARLGAAAPHAAAPMRALQGAVGNRAVQRVMGSRQQAAARDVHASDAGTVQRKKNPERERLERIRMWSERIQQDGVDAEEALEYAEAFANRSTSIITVLAFAVPLHEEWHAADVIELVNEFVADPGGRTLNEWVTLGIRSDDLGDVPDAARAGNVEWVNAAATFSTANDRYTTTLVKPVGDYRVYALQGANAVLEDVTLPDGGKPVHYVQGAGKKFLAREDLKDLITSDSVYTVTATDYRRYAPVNTVHAPVQVNFQATRHFVYVTKGTEAYKAIRAAGSGVLRVTAVRNGQVIFDVNGDEHGASIEPSEGDQPFDFNYNAGTGGLSHRHFGHPLYDLR